MPSREEKKAATRKKLLAAAATLVAKQGALATSLDAIAEKAGLTKGAVYSNFGSKEELLFEMAAVAAGPSVHREFVAGVPMRDQLESLGRDIALANRTVARRAWQLGIELYTLAMRNSRFRRMYVENDRENRAAAAANFDGVIAANGEHLPFNGEELYTVINALAIGLSQARTVDPDAVPEELFARAFRALAG